MHWLRILLLALLVTAAALRAQERLAKVVLDDGTTVQGRVLQMSVAALQLEVDGKAFDIPAARIATCTISLREPPPDPGPGAAPDPVADAPGAEPTAAPQSGPELVVRPESASRGNAMRRAQPRAGRTGDGELPHDLRHRSLFRSRLEALDARYPWLTPVSSLQWCSLLVMAFTLLSLGLHLAVRAAGAEAPPFGRVAALAGTVLILGVLQFAWLPIGSGTAALAVGGVDLLLLVLAFTSLFELGVVGGGISVLVTAALVALVALVLELVTRVLASIGAVT